jgi:hypothetical protein
MVAFAKASLFTYLYNDPASVIVGSAAQIPHQSNQV